MHSKLFHMVSAVCTLFLFSCNLFETRDPENPITDNQTLPPPSTKEALFSNFQTAIQQKNLTEYEKLFADTVTHKQSFLFVPAARYASIFPGWNKSSELDYFRNVITAVGSSSIQFGILSAPQILTYQSDSAVYTIQYSLFVPHNKPGVTTQFTGRSELYMSPNKNNIWMIYRWADFETMKDSSWSELKGQFVK